MPRGDHRGKACTVRRGYAAMLRLALIGRDRSSDVEMDAGWPSEPAPIDPLVRPRSVGLGDSHETVILLDVPLIELLAVSVAVMVWLPAVCRVAEKVPVPLVSVESAGRLAAPSELVK